MAVIPTGSPIWAKTATHEDYGGHVDKKNYASQGAVNPLTDVTAQQFSRLAADVTAVARVADFAVINMTLNDTATDPPTVNSVRMNTGATSTAYEGDAAPSGFPSAAYVAPAVASITFDSSYTDEYGVAQDLFIEDVLVTVQGTTAGFGNYSLSASKLVVTVYIFDENGSAETDRTITVAVST